MKLFTLCIVLALASFSTCQNNVPTFTWIEDELSPSGVPLLSINFNDGGSNDVAVLKQFNPIPKGSNEREEDIDRCIFEGFLRNEEKVYVTLTGGCPFENSFDIQLRSKRVVDHMFKVTEGKVEVIVSVFQKENQPFVDTALKVPNSENQNYERTPLPQNGYNLKVKMHHDQSLKSIFGGDTVNVMRRVVAQAQNIYYWPTLPTIVTIVVVGEYEIQDYINADQPSMDLVGSAYANDPNVNSFLFLSNRYDASPAAGLGYVNVVCSGSGQLQYRIAISEYYNNDMESAEYLAHELGHNLGMNHDFGNSPSDYRYDSQGRLCTGINGVMDYAASDKWTTCSYEDFAGSNHGCIEQN